jgi:glycerate dehydrogenase
MKIVVLDGFTMNPGDISWQPLEALGDLRVYDRTPPDRTVERIGDAQVVLTNKTRLSAEVINAAPQIKYVGVLATGYDVVDVAAAKQRGVPVCNVPGYATDAVAEMVFALLLEMCRHIGAHSDAVKNGEWTASPDFCFWKHPMSEVSGKTLGIVGLGRTGQRTAQIAQAFGMRVLAVSQSRPLAESDTLRYVTTDTLLAESDVISLHCPLTEHTRHMIGSDALARMKSGVMLINTARGGLIDERALAEALESGKVASAACDVVSAEPIREDNPLLTAKNIIITPHIAWASRPSRERLMAQTVNNVKAFLAGQPVNVVNGI